MITLRRSAERYYDLRRKQEQWLTFRPRILADPLVDSGSSCFGSLESVSENRLPPGTALSPRAYVDTEILTYVRQGSLRYSDSTGSSGVLEAGDFQQTSAGRGLRRSEVNGSRNAWAHVFQTLLRSAEAGLELSPVHRRFSAAERRGRFCPVATFDGRSGSLLIHQSVLVYSALLGPGQRLTHELLPDRSAWLHLVQGEAMLQNYLLTTGDGAAIETESSISIMSVKESEVLLFDLARPEPLPPRAGGRRRPQGQRIL